jgi:hypothetical protein
VRAVLLGVGLAGAVHLQDAPGAVTPAGTEAATFRSG